MTPAQRRRWLPAGLAYGVGVLGAVQSRITGELSHRLGGGTSGGLLAALVSFGTAFFMLLVLVLAAPALRGAAGGLPSAVRGGRLRWWMLLGGLGGASLVAAQGITVPTLGVALFTVAVVAGQTTSSLVVDGVGLAPGGRRPLTGSRVGAAALATGAVGLAVSGRVSAGTLALGMVLLVAATGGLTAAQQAVNGRVAQATGEPFVAALVNMAVGTVGLLLVRAVASDAGAPGVGDLPAPWAEPVLWLAGLIGVAFVATGARVVPVLGVLEFSLLSVAGMLTGSLALDVVLPTAATEVTARVVGGVLLAGVAVAVAALPGRPGRGAAARGA